MTWDSLQTAPSVSKRLRINQYTGSVPSFLLFFWWSKKFSHSRVFESSPVATSETYLSSLKTTKAAERSEGIILRVGEKFGFIKLGLLRWAGGGGCQVFYPSEFLLVFVKAQNNFA